MSHELTEFEWTDEKYKAAKDLASGVLTDEDIAGQAGVTRRQLARWKTHPDFQSRIQEHLDDFREETRRRGLADRERRVAALNDRWVRMQRVLEARADDPALQHVPGGTTGLLVHNVKGVGKGEDFQLIDLYEVDTALLRELREHEKQAAQELGQWVDKQSVDQVVKGYVTLGPDEL
jgi:hypothetical protein